ncbi:hypothetical protein CPB85DRAFT_1459024 [Mucidula mucida]|nr:hypothetical protein CPB85DRAFT_1459024 [Mucidula mucida]
MNEELWEAVLSTRLESASFCFMEFPQLYAHPGRPRAKQHAVQSVNKGGGNLNWRREVEVVRREVLSRHGEFGVTGRHPEDDQKRVTMPPSLLSTATVKDLMRSPNRVYQSYQELLRDCQKWRVYHTQEVYPLEESLRLEAVVTLPLTGCPSPGDVATGFRMPPPLLRLDANRSERTLDGILVVTRPLRDEKHARPHTWLVDVVGINDRDSETSVGRVVLMIAQQSRMIIPDTSDRNRNISRLRVPHHITLVAHDFLMFEKLEHLQGGSRNKGQASVHHDRIYRAHRRPSWSHSHLAPPSDLHPEPKPPMKTGSLDIEALKTWCCCPSNLQSSTLKQLVFEDSRTTCIRGEKAAYPFGGLWPVIVD